MADDFQSNRNCEHCGGNGFIDTYPQFANGARWPCQACLDAQRTTIDLLYTEAKERRIKNKMDYWYDIESHYIYHLEILKM